MNMHRLKRLEKRIELVELRLESTTLLDRIRSVEHGSGDLEAIKSLLKQKMDVDKKVHQLTKELGEEEELRYEQ